MKRQKALSKKNKMKKLVVFILILLLVVALIFLAFKVIGKNKDEGGRKVVDEIKKFDYTVSETDTKLFKETFSELKKELSKDEHDNENYASLVSKLFVIDFFTLNNKTNVNDVGGVQFVFSSYKADFVDKARSGIYKQVKSNLDNNRTQDLPEVMSVEISSIDEVDPSSIFDSNDFKEIEKAYEINITWTYKNNNEFQSSATITVISDGNKLSIGKLEN